MKTHLDSWPTVQPRLNELGRDWSAVATASSERAGQRVMEGITRFVTHKLKLRR